MVGNTDKRSDVMEAWRVRIYEREKPLQEAVEEKKVESKHGVGGTDIGSWRQ